MGYASLTQPTSYLETRKQLAKVGDYPDIIFAPCGGGSNVGGMMFPFLADKAAGKIIRLVAVEPSSCPTLTRGRYAYDYGDTAGHTPLFQTYPNLSIDNYVLV